MATKSEIVGLIGDVAESLTEIAKKVSELSAGVELTPTEQAVINVMRGGAKPVTEAIEVPVKVNVSTDVESGKGDKPAKRKRRTKAEIAADKVAKEPVAETVVLVGDDDDDLTTSVEDATVSEPTIEEEKLKKVTKKKAPAALKPDTSLPEEPEEITLNSLRNYSGAVMRALDDGLAFFTAVNDAIKEAGLEELVLMEEEDAEAAFKVVQGVVASFVAAQTEKDENAFGAK